jgi:hypothetical protein
VHENAGNPALNTRPTILNLFVHFYYFIDGLVKSFISNLLPFQDFEFYYNCSSHLLHFLELRQSTFGWKLSVGL